MNPNSDDNKSFDLPDLGGVAPPPPPAALPVASPPSQDGLPVVNMPPLPPPAGITIKTDQPVTIVAKKKMKINPILAVALLLLVAIGSGLAAWKGPELLSQAGLGDIRQRAAYEYCTISCPNGFACQPTTSGGRCVESAAGCTPTCSGRYCGSGDGCGGTCGGGSDCIGSIILPTPTPTSRPAATPTPTSGGTGGTSGSSGGTGGTTSGTGGGSGTGVNCGGVICNGTCVDGTYCNSGSNCGNGVCGSGETSLTCASDCGNYGLECVTNSQCSGGESCINNQCKVVTAADRCEINTIKCSNNTSYTCTGGVWTIGGDLCGTSLCTNGANKCEGGTFSECIGGNWQNRGTCGTGAGTASTGGGGTAPTPTPTPGVGIGGGTGLTNGSSCTQTAAVGNVACNSSSCLTYLCNADGSWSASSNNVCASTCVPGGLSGTTVGAVSCNSYNCNGDPDGDGQCKDGGSGGSGASCSEPACGQVDYYDAAGNLIGFKFTGGFPNCTSGGGGGGTTTTTTTTTNNPIPVCLAITAFTKDTAGTFVATTPSEIPTKVKIGDTIRFTVNGAHSTFTKARFVINGVPTETTEFVNGKYQYDYVINQAGAISVQGQLMPS